MWQNKRRPRFRGLRYFKQEDAKRLNQYEDVKLLGPSSSLELSLVDVEQRLAQIHTVGSEERRRCHHSATGCHPCTWGTL